MRRIIPITDLQRQAGQIVSSVVESGEPVIVTLRGRAAVVLLSAARYSQIEEDLQRLDELELLEMVTRSREAIARGDVVSHKDVKARLTKRRVAEQRRARRSG